MILNKKTRLLPFLAALMMAASACGTTPTQTGTKRLRVVATFSVLGDFAARVAGSTAEVVVIVPAGADAHEFEPAPSDAARVADADLIVENGVEFETWLDALYGSSGSKARRVIASEGIALRESSEHHESGATAEEKHSEDEHAHGEHDPHVWQDVRNAIQMVRNVAEGMASVDSVNAAQYRANADAYIAELQKLDAEIEASIAQIPQENRRIVTTHDSLGYFGARYGVEIVGEVIDSLSTEAGEPSAQEIAALIDAIREKRVRAIFSESITNPQLVQRIADESGARIGGDLFTDALGGAGSGREAYVDAMRANLTMLTAALR